MCRKLPPTVFPIGTCTLPPRMIAETSCRAQPGVRVDLAAQQTDQHGGALGVADEDDRAPVVVMRQVVLPPRQEALIRHQVGARIATQPLGQRRRGALAVHRRPDPADLREPRGLRDRGGDLRFLHCEVGVVAELLRHGRIDVEAVELRGRGRAKEASATVAEPLADTVVEAGLVAHGSPACPGRQSHTVPDGAPAWPAAAAALAGAPTQPSARRGRPRPHSASRAEMTPDHRCSAPSSWATSATRLPRARFTSSR